MERLPVWPGGDIKIHMNQNVQIKYLALVTSYLSF